VRDRGATLVEYALLVGLIAIVAIGALTVLGRNSSDQVDEVAAKIDTEPGDDGGDGGGDGGGGGGGATTTTGVGPTTTVAPLPTTTTTPPTTATTAPPVGPEFPETSGFAPAQVDPAASEWAATADLVVRDESGIPLPATVATVDIWRYELTWDGWRWRRRTVTVTTGPDGVAEVRTLDFPDSGRGEVDRLIFVLTDADHHLWDGVEDHLDFSP
jgi:Flp pilus assembly pilin Flp